MQPCLDKPYAELADIDKEGNSRRGRIPELLALVGLGLRRDVDGHRHRCRRRS
jgi:hypothetical protein